MSGAKIKHVRVVVDAWCMCEACGGNAVWIDGQPRPTLCASCAIDAARAEAEAEDRKQAMAERRFDKRENE